MNKPFPLAQYRKSSDGVWNSDLEIDGKCIPVEVTYEFDEDVLINGVWLVGAHQDQPSRQPDVIDFLPKESIERFAEEIRQDYESAYYEEAEARYDAWRERDWT